MKKTTLILLSFLLLSQVYSQNYIEETKRKNEAVGYNNSGVQKKQQKDYTGAMLDFKKAIEIYPKAGWAYHNRADLKSTLGDYRGAIEDYNKALEVGGGTSVFAGRANAKKELKDYKGAIEDYNKSIGEFGDDIFSSYKYKHRGECKQKLGDITGACSDWRKAGELGDIDAYDLIRKYCN